MQAIKGFVGGWLVIGLCLVASSASAQTLQEVTFTASADHAATLGDGTAKLTSYELVLANKATTPPTVFATISLGKPTPNAQSVITLKGVPLAAPLSAGEYEGRISAVGPGGRSADLIVPFSKAGPPAAPTGPARITP